NASTVRAVSVWSVTTIAVPIVSKNRAKPAATFAISHAMRSTNTAVTLPSDSDWVRLSLRWLLSGGTVPGSLPCRVSNARREHHLSRAPLNDDHHGHDEPPETQRSGDYGYMIVIDVTHSVLIEYGTNFVTRTSQTKPRTTAHAAVISR